MPSASFHFLVLTEIWGMIYPVSVINTAQIAFPNQANGSIIIISVAEWMDIFSK
ncbi:potassium-transporting ATPase subunit C [Acetobacterium woodii]|uniref:potassium-transporting ATPase subunit C n=1 Tax=Acetobacterium woodii TaxID=33952 RepID=UPI0011AEB7AD